MLIPVTLFIVICQQATNGLFHYMETNDIRLFAWTFTSRNKNDTKTYYKSLCLVGVNANVRRWARSCIQCQRAKVHKHSITPHSTFTIPDARFDIVHIDLVGPLPPSKGFTYLLTCIDRFTRWPEAIPLTSATTKVIAQGFLNGWIARFGVPSTIVTDRGRQFESHLWNSLMILLGTKRVRTTAYHPQSNGMIERFHRQYKAALKAQHNPMQWMDALPLVLLGIRSAVKQDLSTSTAELVYGTTLRLPALKLLWSKP